MEQTNFVVPRDDSLVGLEKCFTRPAKKIDADLVYQLYQETPDYFQIISIPMPTLAEVETELETAERDPRRHTELILMPSNSQLSSIHDEVSGGDVVAYLDYKLNYPEEGDAMVNLLLVLGRLQSQGVGRQAVLDLEGRLAGRAKRILASIYGQNSRAKRFWKTLGYTFAIDAKPVLDWYAKALI